LGSSWRVLGWDLGCAVGRRLFSDSRGSVLVAKPILGALLTGFESAALTGGLSALAVGLIHLGIPKEDALKYECPVKADKFLVIANGTSDEVARARMILVDERHAVGRRLNKSNESRLS
jgi:hypothetical protein